MMKCKVAMRMRLNIGSSSCSRGYRTELDKCLAEELEDNYKKFDILDWWKGQSPRFPILSRLARDVLAIPISIGASESAFSTSGRILDDFRTSLTPFMVKALVCTKVWLKRGHPINIAENTEELTKLEEELIQEFKDKAIIDSNASKSLCKAARLPPSHNKPDPPSASHSQAQASPPSLHLHDHACWSGDLNRRAGCCFCFFCVYVLHC